MFSHPWDVGCVPLPHTDLPVARLVQLDAAERLFAVESGKVLVPFS
ncbi:hypothetical protein ABIA10_000966 [Rhizobium leguminosarum]